MADRALRELGLRERKKVKTRSTILQVAEKLFLKEGYDRVTLEQIADICEVSVRTVLRYFDTKEELALAKSYDLLETFEAGLAARDGDVLSYWREHVATNAAKTAENLGGFRKYFAMVSKHPALAARYIAVSQGYEDALADAIAEETGDREGLRSRLLAAMLVAGNSAVARHWLVNKEPFDAEVFVRVVDYAAEAFGNFSPTASPTSKRRRR